MSEFLEVKNHVLAAGVPLDLAIKANFFQLFQAPTAVDVEFFSHNTRVGQAHDAPEGFRRGPLAAGKEFDRVRITSAVNQTLQVCLAYGEASLQRIVGNITATLTKAATLADAADVVVVQGAAAAQIIAASAARRTVMIKSLSTNTQSVRLGAAPGAARGYELVPGESVFWDVTAAIKAWTAAGANQTLAIVEIDD